MKRIILLTLCVIVMISMLCGCGKDAIVNQGPAEMKSELPDANLKEMKKTETPPPKSSNDEEDDIEPDYEELLSKAGHLLGKESDYMLANFGEPIEKMVMPSARGRGKDGVYKYKNIICYTYSEGIELIIGVAIIDNHGEEIYYLPEVNS